MDKLKIGLIGLGTVGSGVYKSLKDFGNIEIVKIAVKDKSKKRNIENFDESILTEDIYEVVTNPDIDIVVEVIGGVNPALDLIKTAIENGKHIVTANKELLAKKGEELFTFAEKHNKVILYEAAIAGGIPIITPIKTILSGNKIHKNFWAEWVKSYSAFFYIYRGQKPKIKIKGEQAGTKLLVPMMVLLVLVFAILLVPAFQSF